MRARAAWTPWPRPAGSSCCPWAGVRSAPTPADGAAFNLAAVLDESDRAGFCDLPVQVLDGRAARRAPLPARLVALRKPPQAADRARRKGPCARASAAGARTIP
jgi:hypothetical protein